MTGESLRFTVQPRRRDRSWAAAHFDRPLVHGVLYNGRCKSLAGAEALRCQRRICENYWGRAEACPRSLAPAGDHTAQNESSVRP